MAMMRVKIGRFSTVSLRGIRRGSNLWYSTNKARSPDSSTNDTSDCMDNTDSADGENTYEDVLKELKEKGTLLQQRDTEVAELKEKYLRCLAEIDNTQKRMKVQIDDAKKFGIQGFSKDLVEVADILEKAMESVPQKELDSKANPHLHSLFEGLKITKNELQNVFIKNGLERIDPIGEEFNPAVHQALFEVVGEKSGTVGVVSKVGYILNGRTVRPALVGVVKKS